MTPVINPWVFYWMPVCENLSTLSWILFIVTSVVIAGAFLVWILASGCYDDEAVEMAIRILKVLIPIALVLGFLACLIPTEETITKMIVAQNVTYERVDVVTDTVANVYNDIMNLFSESGAANG